MSNAVFLLFVFMFCSFLCLCDQPARPQQTFLRSHGKSAEKGHGLLNSGSFIRSCRNFLYFITGPAKMQLPLSDLLRLMRRSLCSAR